jgi:hypothetical protein
MSGNLITEVIRRILGGNGAEGHGSRHGSACRRRMDLT